MAATTTAARKRRPGAGRKSARSLAASAKPPIEYSILYTATLCLMAAGAVMVYSASSAESLLGGTGDPSYYFKRYLLFGLVGLLAMHVSSRVDLRRVRTVTPAFLLVSFGLTAALLLPGVGVEINGATRWINAGPIQFQPSEMLKLAVILYSVQLLASRPSCLRTLGGMLKPLLLVVMAACALLLVQPDLGTAMVICFAVGTLLVVAGAKMRHLLLIACVAAILVLLLILIEPYRRERLFSFLDPWSDAQGSGFQVVQSMIAIGSGGLFGTGLGESVQKVFYLPEAHTDMILAIVGEEVGVFGIVGVVALYGLIAYAGLRTAKAASDRYTKLLAAGVTSLIVCQATLNLFAVMGMAPLTGVPLPFMSYGMTNLIMLMAAMGLLLNVANGGRVGAAKTHRRRSRLEMVGDDRRQDQGRHRGRRDRGPRGSRPGRRGLAAG